MAGGKLARCHPFTSSAKADWRLCADGRRVNVPKKRDRRHFAGTAERASFFPWLGLVHGQHKTYGGFGVEVRTRINKKDEEPICWASVNNRREVRVRIWVENQIINTSESNATVNDANCSNATRTGYEDQRRGPDHDGSSCCGAAVQRVGRGGTLRRHLPQLSSLSVVSCARQAARQWTPCQRPS